MLPDVDLMCRVRDGDLPAYTQLWERHRASLTAFLASKTRCPLTAEELAAEVFWRIYRHRDGYQPTAKFTTWLYTVAGNLAVNWRRDVFRSQRRQGRAVSLTGPIADCLPARELTAEQLLLARVQRREVLTAIRRLPSNQRAALILHRFRGLPYAAVADRLHCSESAVKSLLFRAYQNLRSSLRTA